MPQFSRRSFERLNECHPLLKRVMLSAIEVVDFSVTCGYRGEGAQNEAYASGHSRLQWPKSKHNKSPSEAVDIVPYPIDWDDIDRFRDLASVIKVHWEKIPLAERGGLELHWGGDWEKFKDMPHWELRKKW